jgi:hypothetical protein
MKLHTSQTGQAGSWVLLSTPVIGKGLTDKSKESLKGKKNGDIQVLQLVFAHTLLGTDLPVAL